MNFVIITTVYNAEGYIKRCIDSIKGQNYSNWKSVIINDCSTDNTWSVIQENVDDRFITVNNKENKKALVNYIEYIPQYCKDGDIIVSLDGDDCLYGNDVLSYLNHVYQDSKIKVTYGSYVLSTEVNNPKSHDCNYPITSINDLKRVGFNMSHLKTWKYDLWKKIPIDNMKGENGKIIQCTWDIPIVVNLCLLCDDVKENVKYIEKPLYVYNIENQSSEFRVNRDKQNGENQYVRKKLLGETIGHLT